MKLTELEPQWIRYEERVDGRYLVTVDSLAEAHGICFLCPKCFQANGGNAGTHSVVCWFEGRVADEVQPGPGRWNPTGDSFESLSFVPGRKTHSVLLLGGCAWHGFVTNGDVT